MKNKVALVTGASRGIGAATVEILATKGFDVVINYREKKSRADAVAQLARASGVRAETAQADLTDIEATQKMFDYVANNFGGIDVLILNASGGLERGMPSDYAMRLNRDAQVRAVELASALMGKESRIVFVTSHAAHFYDGESAIPEYAPVAASKKAGEISLREQIPALNDAGISVIVVSGDIIEGTITAKLLDRSHPGLIDKRRQQVGRIPTIEEFATAIVEAANDPSLPSGTTIYIGEKSG